jgi:predicted RNA-binding Zn ribbon-like protein
MATRRLPVRVTGVLCLDFVNTVEPRASTRPGEHLVDPGVLVDWAADAGAVDEELAAGIHAWVGGHRELAERELAGLLARREALYRVLLAALPAPGSPGPAPPAGQAAGDRDRRLVAGWVAAARRHAVLVPGRPRWRWEWPAEATLRRAWWPVAESAGELLAGRGVDHLGVCDNPGCGWLYLDTTKNHSRRWCSMELCGNAAKSRRHAARSRAARGR